MIEMIAVVFWPVFRFLASDLHWQYAEQMCNEVHVIPTQMNMTVE